MTMEQWGAGVTAVSANFIPFSNAAMVSYGGSVQNPLQCSSLSGGFRLFWTAVIQDTIILPNAKTLEDSQMFLVYDGNPPTPQRLQLWKS